jgi:PAS domain S-box-containing protein
MHPITQSSSTPGDFALSDERFRQLVDNAPFMVWVSGPDGSCTFFNRPWLEFRGRSMAEEAGEGWVEGVHPEDRPGCLETYRQALQARRQFRMEYRLRRADGEYVRIVDSGIPQFGEGRTFLGYIGSCIDIQEVRTPRGNTPLTSRELQVLTLVAEGKSTKEVAALLLISYKTADSHRSRIMEKLGVHETASLVRYAIRQGIVQA